MDDSYGQQLADARETLNTAARNLLVLRKNGTPPNGMTMEQAEGLLTRDILEMQAIIDRLGFRSN